MPKLAAHNPYTQRQIERAIKAALSAGLKVIGVRPDGTVLTGEPDYRLTIDHPPLTDRPKLRDAREKLGAY
jgi:hypothetical protein